MANSNSDNHKSELLAAFLEDRLSAADRAQFNELCASDKAFAETVEQANYMAMLNETASATSVPVWDKESTFHRAEKIGWWHVNGLSFASLACSILAVFMVLSGLNVHVEDGRLSMGFSAQFSKQGLQEQVQLMVRERLNDYQQANQQLLAQYLDSLQQQQMATNKQFTDYLLASSRQERREDFAELIQFVNQQRYDDQVFFARQLNELQQELNSQAGFKLDAVRPITDINLDE